MKVYKKSLVILTIAFAAVVIVAIVLPLQSNVRETVRFSAQSDALFRQLMRDTIWHRWWPGRVEMANEKKVFVCDDFAFTIERILPNTLELKTTSGSFASSATLYLTPEADSKVMATLATSFPLSHNPVDRVKLLFISSDLRTVYKKILAGLSQHFTTVRSLYDFDIKFTTVSYEYVTTTSQTISHAPRVSEIYILINQVKSYIAKNYGLEKGFPMLHVSELTKGQFFVQVAIPTDKKLSEAGNMKSKWMLKGGHIVSAEVVGNPAVISLAKKQVENFIFDNHKVTVAISYEYLITNRLEQPDSNKWVTELYYPII